MDGHKQGVIHLGDPRWQHIRSGPPADRRRECAPGPHRGVAGMGTTRRSSTNTRAKRFNSPRQCHPLVPMARSTSRIRRSTFPKGQQQEIPFQAVYHLNKVGNVTLLTKELTQPNGLAFSPDGKTFYVNDSEQRNIPRIRLQRQWHDHQWPHLWRRARRRGRRCPEWNARRRHWQPLRDRAERRSGSGTRKATTSARWESRSSPRISSGEIRTTARSTSPPRPPSTGFGHPYTGSFRTSPRPLRPRHAPWTARSRCSHHRTSPAAPPFRSIHAPRPGRMPRPPAWSTTARGRRTIHGSPRRSAPSGPIRISTCSSSRRTKR